MRFADRVAIITGASRGVGRALALGLAREGCHIVVAAKSTEEDPALPGTVHSVAAEVKALGRQALPFPVDVRHESRLQEMVRTTLERFGRVDFLVNNAGALFWDEVEQTPGQRYDLVNAVNARAAFIAARECLAPMRAQGFGHILNMSPPIDPRAAVGKVAYAISKFGMTLLSIGLAGELEGTGVACNSLWPETLIESFATIRHHLGERSSWRTPEILVDATLEIFSRDPRELSGRALLDETFLREECGVTDFARYRCDPAVEPPKVGFDFRLKAGQR
jgi:citronellol/citronellal dehydrogenase